MKKIAFVTLLILLIDQASKIYVKTHFNLMTVFLSSGI
jgi:signal peptidase II